MLDILKNEYDEEIKNILESDIELITKDMNDLEVELLLNGEYDKNDAFRNTSRSR